MNHSNQPTRWSHHLQCWPERSFPNESGSLFLWFRRSRRTYGTCHGRLALSDGGRRGPEWYHWKNGIDRPKWRDGRGGDCWMGMKLAGDRNTTAVAFIMDAWKGINPLFMAGEIFDVEAADKWSRKLISSTSTYYTQVRSKAVSSDFFVLIAQPLGHYISVSRMFWI